MRQQLCWLAAAKRRENWNKAAAKMKKKMKLNEAKMIIG
jgi:hypothetical protein